MSRMYVWSRLTDGEPEKQGFIQPVPLHDVPFWSAHCYVQGNDPKAAPISLGAYPSPEKAAEAVRHLWSMGAHDENRPVLLLSPKTQDAEFTRSGSERGMALECPRCWKNAVTLEPGNSLGTVVSLLVDHIENC